MPPRSVVQLLSLLALPAVTVSGASETAAPPLPADSPFLPPADAPDARSDSSPDAYALVGMTVVGQDTLLSLTRQSDKRSFWIPVGHTLNGVTAISYDPRADRAVIRAEGQSFTLLLRKADAVAHPATAPASVTPIRAVPAAPSSTATPPPGVLPNRPMTVQEEKEMEARMLVTDLLEIGQQQRKAYEEAQRQAARAKTTPPPATDAPRPPSPPPDKPRPK